MESIFIPPKAGAPFSLTLDTEWSRPMSGGGTFTLANERHIVRDSKGRIYQERWGLVPKGGKDKSVMGVFQVTDPELHTWFNCNPWTKVCDLYRYSLSTKGKFDPPIGTSGPLPDGSGFAEWLTQTKVESRHWEAHLTEIPLGRIPQLIAEAKTRSAEWTEFAAALEQRFKELNRKRA